MTLEHLLVSEVFAVMLVFARIGSAMMLMPGVGEMYVPMRIRLLLSLTVSHLLAPVMMPHLPPVPGNVPMLMLHMLREITVGVFLGMATKTLLATMHMAGMVIAMHANFATAMLFDASQGGQSATVGVFLSITALLMLLVTDTHLLMLQAFVDSYALIEPGRAVPWGDMSNYASRMLADSFDIAIRLSMPFVIVSLLVSLGAGVISRLMPHFQVFFVLMPVQIKLALLMMVGILPELLFWYHQHLREQVEHLLEF